MTEIKAEVSSSLYWGMMCKLKTNIFFSVSWAFLSVPWNRNWDRHLEHFDSDGEDDVDLLVDNLELAVELIGGLPVLTIRTYTLHMHSLPSLSISLISLLSLIGCKSLSHGELWSQGRASHLHGLCQWPRNEIRPKVHRRWILSGGLGEPTPVVKRAHTR